MQVKQKYSFLSESLMYEWTLETPTPFNRAKQRYFAYWQSVKNLDTKELTFDDVLRLEKIIDIQARELKPKRYRAA